MSNEDKAKQNYKKAPVGIIILDLNEQELPEILRNVVDRFVSENILSAERRDAVVERIVNIKDTDSNKGKNSRSLSINSAENNKESSLDGNSFTRLSSFRKSISKVFQIRPQNSYKRFGSTRNTLTVSDAHEIPQYRKAHSDSYLDLATERIGSNSDQSVITPKESTVIVVKSIEFIKAPIVAFVRLKEPIKLDIDAENESSIQYLFVVLGQFKQDKDYSPIEESISNLLSDTKFCEVAKEAKTSDILYPTMQKVLQHPSASNNNTTVKVPNISITVTEQVTTKRGRRQITKKPVRDPLQRKGRLFYGLIQDAKIRYSQYWSDIKDGFSLQVLSACIFIFFAALSPSITFGGMYSDKTDRYIGVGETLLVSSINGIIFALFAAQPLLIVGATGPLMIFDMSLLQFSDMMDLDFLSLRVWVGIWILLIGLLVAAFELVSVVKHFTRFTEEIFSTFVCFIFIYGAFEKLAAIFKQHPLTSSSSGIFRADGTQIYNGSFINGTLVTGTNMEGNEIHDTEITQNQPNTALLSLCLMIGTFLIAWKLKRFRNSKYLGRSVRRALGDFGVPIAIFLMVLVDYLIKDTYTDKLTMPKGLQPSNSEVRGWLINPLGEVTPLPLWCMFATFPAAILLFILIFLEENICHLILSKPERCLKKGTGFHLDIVLSCLINTISGFLGAPFMGPATVRTIAHMSALTVMGKAFFGRPPSIVDCIEQRVSGLTVSVLVGLAVMLYQVLNLVPKAVLYGVFLYMGVSATAGIQMLERIVLYFVPVKYHGNASYTKDVSTKKMHVFTTVQVVALAILWAVKQSPAALAVPFVLLCLIPLRLYILPYFFSTEELVSLDGAKVSKGKTDGQEADFYESAHALPTQIDDDLMGPRMSISDMGRRLSQIASSIVEVRK